jgi:peroxiredoxin
MLNVATRPFTSSATVELGPTINTTVPPFTVRDHAGDPQHINDLLGEKGLLLGFTGNIWNPTNARRIIWAQRHAHHINSTGVNVALLSCDQPDLLYGFHISMSPPPEFPLLSDLDGQIHALFNMAKYPGMVLLDRSRTIRHKWLVPDDRVWPKIQDILDVVESL